MAKFESNKDRVDYKGSELIRADEEYSCWHCGELTKWIDINFEAPLCSEECEDAKWNEYFEAEKLHSGTLVIIDP